MGAGAREFLDQLASDAVACRAGSRVLQVPDDNGWTASARLWRECGFAHIVDADTVNSQRFNLNLGNTARRIETRELPRFLLHAMKSAPPGLQLGGDSYKEWTANAIGSCAEMGSADAALWLETLCNRVNLRWSLYRQRIVDAVALGKLEFARFEAVKLERERVAGVITLPEQQLLVNGDCDEYLRQIIIRNKTKNVSELAKTFKAQRKYIHETLRIAEEDDLMTWDQARRLL